MTVNRATEVLSLLQVHECTGGGISSVAPARRGEVPVTVIGVPLPGTSFPVLSNIAGKLMVPTLNRI